MAAVETRRGDGGTEESMPSRDREMQRLEGRLRRACELLETYYPDLLREDEDLNHWWMARKREAVKARVLASEEGVAARVVSEIVGAEAV